MVAGVNIKGFFQILLGIVLVVVAVYLASFSSWFWAFFKLVQGSIIAGFLVVGVAIGLLGFFELKEEF